MLITTEKVEAAKTYWLRQLSAELTEVKLITDFPRSKHYEYEKGEHRFALPRDITVKILHTSKSNHLSIYVVLLAGLKVLLFRILNQDDIITASPTYSKSSQEYNRFVLFRDFLSSSMSFKEVLIQVKKTVEEGYKKQYFTISKLLQLLDIKGDFSLFRVILVLESIHKREFVAEIIDEFENDMTLFFRVGEREEEIQGNIVYNAKLFKPDTMERLFDWYSRVLDRVLDDKNLVIGKIEFLSKKEKDVLLYTFNNTEKDYPDGRTIHGLCEDQVEKTPDGTAAVGAHELHESLERKLQDHITYRELNEKAGRLAQVLRLKGVKANTLVGIMLESSIEMVLAILGILKAGGAFLPLEKDNPGDRVTYMLRDCSVGILINDGIDGPGRDIPVIIDISDPSLYLAEGKGFVFKGNPTDLAYVIYTSGTTGKPKGVMIRHFSVVNMLACRADNYKMNPGDTALQLFSYAFDGFITSFFTPVISGAKVVLPTEEGRKDISQITEIIPKHCITHFICVPQLFLGIIENLTPGEAGTLKVVTLAGDNISLNILETVRQKNENLEIANEYGITEASVMSTLNRNQEKNDRITIGRPIWNTRIYIVDERMLQQPIGVPGELCIAGIGVSGGYTNNPELTAEKFVDYRSYRSYKTYILYKTGDLARWLADGNIELLGRLDRQVKLRGLRIELGEVQNRLVSYTDIKEARVMVKEDARGDKYLCAYLVSHSGNEPEISALKEYLSLELPGYMVPRYFVPVPEMPLTRNGKVDVKKLPFPEVDGRDNYEAPVGDVEKKLAEIWAEVLGLKQETISLNDNFFELGGHSLKATILAAKIHREFNIKVPLAVIFDIPVMRELSGYIKDAAKEDFISIQPVERKEFYALSSAQKRLYALYRMDPGSIVYNTYTVMPLEAEPDRERLETVFCQLIERHESLRTSFILAAEEPVQWIHNEVAFEIEYDDGNPELENRDVKEIIRDFVRPFDLSRAPLLRIGLVRLEGKKHILLVDMHHIITDGSSQRVLESEFKALYAGKGLSPLRLQYRDFSGWQNSGLHREVLKQQEEYWLELYRDELPVLDLPMDFQRPAVQSFEGASVVFWLGEEENRKLVERVKRIDVTLYTFVLAVFYILLSKLGGREDIVVGTPVAARRHDDLEKIIGMMVNTLALRNYPAGWKTFKTFLTEVKQNTIQAFENQEYPFEELVNRVTGQRDACRNPMFDVMFNFLEKHGIQAEKSYRRSDPGSYLHRRSIAKFDLTLTCMEFPDEVLFSFEYCTDLADSSTIDRFIRYFERIVHQVLDNSEIAVGEIDLLSSEELEEFNDTEVWHPADKTIHGLFEEQVVRTPDGVAVVGRGCMDAWMREGVHITYRELNKRSDQLVQVLRERGVLVDDIIGIMMERSVEMIIGMLGILKAGAAYLPIDPDYPEERIDYMLADSSTRLLLTSDELLDVSRGTACCGPINQPAPATSLAYVIYTSGSTGRPKGVAVQHSSIVNTLWWQKSYYGFNTEESVLQIPSFSFDSSVEDIFAPLISGSRLVLIEQENRFNLEYLAKRIINQRITHFLITPGLYRAFLNEIAGSLTGLKTVTLAGESFTAELVNGHFKKLPAVRLYNEYGPTENSVCSTVYEFTGDNDVRIGKPVNNVKVFILNRGGGLNPVGVPGELCVSGAGLARGYLNNPELTAEKFFSISSKKLYKTGDLARWLPDGNIEFLGRMDEQVKIRGFRIEPGEIETRLREHDKISEAVVIAREDERGEKYLCAYIVSQVELTALELREYLAPELPDYMIPWSFTRLTKLPLAPNGKIDRRVLPEPEKIWPGGDIEYVSPRNEVEKTLKETWETVLGKDKISISDNFFIIGGDSIKSIQIAARMKKAGYRVEMRDIFRNPSIAELAVLVKKEERIPDQSVVVGTIPLTLIQQAFFREQKIDRHHYNHAVMLYAEEGFDEEAVRTVFKKIQEHHDALRMTYKEEKGKIIQTNHGLEYPFSLEVYEWQNRENVEDVMQETVNRIQASICLEKGPLMKLALFHLNEGDRLLIIIHHLVIDGISWRILFEDIETLYRQYKKGENLELPPKSDSFKLWSEKLSVYADKEEFLREKHWWERLESTDVPVIEKDFHQADNYMKDAEHLRFRLDEEETKNLLTKANEPFGTEINDILLTALGLAVKKTWGINRVLIALESHGRQEIVKDVDVSRTIGWFSSIYPVLLKLSSDTDLSRQVKEIKENLRQVPNKGIGYGILRYLTSQEHKAGLEFKLNPQIGFNYMGQFDADMEQHTFKTRRESVGNVLSPHIKRDYEIDISGMIANGRLFMSIIYNKNQYREVTLRGFLEHYKAELRRIISYCCQDRGRELTPSDLTFNELSIAEIEAVEAIFNKENKGNIKDIYPLSPMQEGMFFHCLYNTSASEYFEQVSYRLYGDLNKSWVEKSLNELLKRHDILRTAFIHDVFDRPLQVVLKQRRVDFYFEDLTHLIDKEEKALYIKKFKEQDRQRSFELDMDVLMRVSLFRTDDKEYELTWSHHHLLMDGWCAEILISEFLEIYNSLLEGRSCALPEAVQYRTYIQWLEQKDKELSGKYWQEYLEGYEEAAVIPRINKPGGTGAGYKLEKMVFPLGRETTRDLDNLAVRNRVTLNTVMRAIWGIILARYNDRQDVVFGAVVSGRPPDVEGIETMVGVFINTIPVRLRFDVKTTFKELIRRVQEDAVESEPYHYYRLAEIQAQTPLKHNLLDHILAFQNIRPGDWTRNKAKNSEKSGKGLELELGSFETYEHSNYDLNVVVNPGTQLRISFHYNSNVYGKELLERIFYHFKQVTDQILENEEAVIVQLDFLSADEKSRLIKKIWSEKGKLPFDDTGIMENREKSLEANFNF